MLIGTFIVIPLAVWGLLVFIPDDPANRLGVLLLELLAADRIALVFVSLIVLPLS